jgi:hypothetical protein
MREFLASLPLVTLLLSAAIAQEPRKQIGYVAPKYRVPESLLNDPDYLKRAEAFLLNYNAVEEKTFSVKRMQELQAQSKKGPKTPELERAFIKEGKHLVWSGLYRIAVNHEQGNMHHSLSSYKGEVDESPLEREPTKANLDASRGGTGYNIVHKVKGGDLASAILPVFFNPKSDNGLSIASLNDDEILRVLYRKSVVLEAEKKAGYVLFGFPLSARKDGEHLDFFIPHYSTETNSPPVLTPMMCQTCHNSGKSRSGPVMLHGLKKLKLPEVIDTAQFKELTDLVRQNRSLNTEQRGMMLRKMTAAFTQPQVPVFGPFRSDFLRSYAKRYYPEAVMEGVVNDPGTKKVLEEQ